MKKKYFYLSWLLLTAALFFLQPCQAQKTVKIQLDSNKEVSGRKLAIRDISPGIPSNSYNGKPIKKMSCKARKVMQS